MLRLNPARMLRAITSAIGLTAARAQAPEVGYHLPRGTAPTVRKRQTAETPRAYRRRAKGPRNALCHHTRFTVRRGTLKRTHAAWVESRRVLWGPA